MTIKTISFDPIRVTVDDVEQPIQQSSYVDENGDNRTVLYVVADGKKVPIQYQADLMQDLAGTKLDDALVRVEEKRIEKENNKDKK